MSRRVMSEERARLLLSLAIEPGDVRLSRALRRAGSAVDLVAALQRSAATWPAGWAAAVEQASSGLDDALRAADVEALRWVVPGDRQWPERLGDLDEAEPSGAVGGAPLGLWLRGGGDLSRLAEASVAVVGARDCTVYGAEAAVDIASASAEAGYTVVSGAAFGIDACAHRGGVQSGDPGMAVLACGADLDYPRVHAALLGRIAEEGVVVSEYAPGRPALRSRFLTRNRLIAALCDGLVVVEAGRRSGSLNTLHWADRLGRTTMAVPGPITAAQSQGTHEAIRSGKAVLVASASDVVAELMGFSGQIASGPEARSNRLAEAVLAALTTHEPRTAAELAGDLRVGVIQVLRVLRHLAAQHRVHRDDDGFWLRVS